MAARAPAGSAPVENLLEALDDALAMLGEFRVPAGREPVAPNPASLLEECLALCAQRDAASPEPVRTLHHFACSGGTLISKCLAAMPNVQILSEVDPLSTVQDPPDGRPFFAPSDLIRLARQSTRGISASLVEDLFLGDLERIRDDAVRRGLRLLLRDHAHGHYCQGPEIPRRPGLRELVSRSFPVVSALTVRHPLDSYTALLANGWANYSPPGLDEYCRRYLAFLSDHDELPLLRYEDFVADPELRMRELCSHLLLPFVADFSRLFDAFRISGDSGRSGNRIAPRERRASAAAHGREVSSSAHYARLCRQLGYAD